MGGASGRMSTASRLAAFGIALALVFGGSWALGTVLGKAVDAADLYFQFSQEESWALEDGIVKEGSSSIEQGVGVRALAGGIAGYVLIWIAAIIVWRQIAVGEYKAAAHKRRLIRIAAQQRMAEMAEERKKKAEEARSAAGR